MAKDIAHIDFIGIYISLHLFKYALILFLATHLLSLQQELPILILLMAIMTT